MEKTKLKLSYEAPDALPFMVAPAKCFALSGYTGEEIGDDFDNYEED